MTLRLRQVTTNVTRQRCWTGFCKKGMTLDLPKKEKNEAIKKAGFREVEFCICLGRVEVNTYERCRVSKGREE